MFGGLMSRQSLLPLMTAVFVCSLLAVSTEPVLAQGRGAPPALPDGVGKEKVQSTCTACHATTLIINSGGYTRQEWIDTFNTMVAVSKADSDELADYLAKAFPPQPRPAPVVIPGPVTVAFK